MEKKISKIALIEGTVLLISNKKKKEKRLKKIDEICAKVYKKCSVSEKKLENTKTKIIWQCWWQGEKNAPKIVQKCFKSVRKYAPDYKRVIIDIDNISDYLTLPDVIWKKYKNGLISRTHFSEILRVCLLAKYGGIWIDATVLLTSPLAKDIKNAPFFVFQFPENDPRLISSWFMVASSESPLTEICKEMLMSYWENTKEDFDYFSMHLMCAYVIKNYKKYNKLFKQVPYYKSEHPHKMHQLLRNKYCEKELKKIRKQSGIHKLTFKEKPSMFYKFFSFLFFIKIKSVARFFYQRKKTKSGKLRIKIFKIPVWRKKLK
ncbi:MAG: capsular polysaccharide synthesis protein [Alphaproteobacteria bacterium]